MDSKLAVINITRGMAIKTELGFKGQHNDLGDAFTFDGWKYLIVTKEQAKSYERVRDEQGFENHVNTYYSNLMGCLMVEFPALVIGIEEDGYAHS